MDTLSFVMIQRGFKFRIYPDEETKSFLAKEFGSARKVFNFFLDRSIKEYREHGKKRSYYEDAAFLTKLKATDGYDYLKENNAQVLQASLKNLDASFTNFFKGRTKFPRFHSRGEDQCIKIPQNFKLDQKNGILRIPKLKPSISIILHRPIEGEIKCVFISKTPTDKYYASFLAEKEMAPLPKNDNVVGLDLGLKSLVITSDGTKFHNPHFLRNLEKKLKYLQRQLSNKKKGSNNRNKARLHLVLLHEYIANCRKDFAHKLTSSLINDNQVIIAETLRVKNMMRNHYLAKVIQDASWGEIIRQLNYKSAWYGRAFYQVDTFFPSSKTCHLCKEINHDLTLDQREWICPTCGNTNDRDINAALNIKDRGIEEISSGQGIGSDVKQKLVEALTSDTNQVHNAVLLSQVIETRNRYPDRRGNSWDTQQPKANSPL